MIHVLPWQESLPLVPAGIAALIRREAEEEPELRLVGLFLHQQGTIPHALYTFYRGGWGSSYVTILSEQELSLEPLLAGTCTQVLPTESWILVNGLADDVHGVPRILLDQRACLLIYQYEFTLPEGDTTHASCS